MQETNLVLWEKRQSFELGTNFLGWAFAIARNKALSHLKKLRRDQRPVLDPELTAELAVEFEQEAQSEHMGAWFDALEQCLSRLTASQRKLVDFRYHSGRSLAEFPGGSSVGALRARLHRIRASLRNCVQSALGEERHV